MAMAGIKSRPVEIARAPKENQVAAFTPTFRPSTKAIGASKSGMKVAANRKYDSANVI
jgi:hypothetical protein